MITVKNKREAEEMYFEFQQEVNRSLGEVNSDLTVIEAFERYIDECRRLNRRATTIESYERYIMMVLQPHANKKLTDLDRNCMKISFDKISKEKSYKDSTYKVIKKSTNAFLNWCVDQEYMGKNPLKRFSLPTSNRPVDPRKKRNRPLKGDEIRTLLDYLDGDPYEVYVKLLLNGGLRGGECRILVWNDCNLEKKTIHVWKTYNRTYKTDGLGYAVKPKTINAERRIPISQEMANLLMEYKKTAKYNKPNDYVFSSATGTPLSKSVLTRLLKRIREGCHFDNSVTYHSLRSCYATLLVEKGILPKELMRRMGHSKIEVTYQYYIEHEEKKGAKQVVISLVH
jgi:integrase